MLHMPDLWYYDTSVIYPQGFRRIKFVITPPRFVYQQYLWNVRRTLHDCPSQMNENLLISNSKLTSDSELIW